MGCYDYMGLYLDINILYLKIVWMIDGRCLRCVFGLNYFKINLTRVTRVQKVGDQLPTSETAMPSQSSGRKRLKAKDNLTKGFGKVASLLFN